MDAVHPHKSSVMLTVSGDKNENLLSDGIIKDQRLGNIDQRRPDNQRLCDVIADENDALTSCRSQTQRKPKGN